MTSSTTSQMMISGLILFTILLARTDAACVDDHTFIYSKKTKVTCKFIQYKEIRRRRYCKVPEINFSCQKTCGTCCKDDVTYTFNQVIIQQGGNIQVKTRKCAWVGEKKSRQRKYCNRNYDGTLLKDICIKSCNQCQSIIPMRKPRLQFKTSSLDNDKKSFKILQLADLHFGENAWTDWGPEQDVKSSEAIKSYLSLERPDLVILSGDQITALNIDRNATLYYETIIGAMTEIESDIKWATLFGNHDDESYRRTFANGKVVEHDAKTTRDDLMRFDIAYNGSYTLQGRAPDFLFGSSNYLIPIYEENGSSKPLAQIFFFDSGGGSIPQINKKNQVKWFQNKMKKGPTANIPSIAFQHISTSAEVFGYQSGGLCQGQSYEGVASVKSDAGLFDTMVESGQVHLFAVGHNHGNDYCCPHHDSDSHVRSILSICFGRHSGYGGYETVQENGKKWQKGARIYVLEMIDGKFSWSSYVRNESGETTDDYKAE